MRKLFLFLFAATITSTSFSQTTIKKINEKSADHFMLQLGGNFWSGAADSVSSRIKAFNRSANVYVMYDKKFKNSPDV